MRQVDAFLCNFCVMKPEINITLVDPQSNNLEYLFPNALIRASETCDKKKYYYASVGVIPYGAFAFTYSSPKDSTDPYLVDIPYLSVVKPLMSNKILEKIFSFIASTLSINRKRIIFSLSLTNDLYRMINFAGLSPILRNKHSIHEVHLDFSMSIVHWQLLWNLFYRNHQRLISQYKLSLCTLSDLISSKSDIFSSFAIPQWANPLNSGFFSPIKSPQNLVLMLSGKPYAWLNSCLVDEVLLFENLWSFPHKKSALFSYSLLFSLFTQINDYSLTKPYRLCYFSYRIENQGMLSLSKRLEPFILKTSMINKLTFSDGNL